MRQLDLEEVLELLKRRELDEPSKGSGSGMALGKLEVRSAEADYWQKERRGMRSLNRSLKAGFQHGLQFRRRRPNLESPLDLLPGHGGLGWHRKWQPSRVDCLTRTSSWRKPWRGEDPASILAGSVGCGYTISTWVFIYTEALPGGRRSPTSWRSPNVFEKP